MLKVKTAQKQNLSKIAVYMSHVNKQLKMRCGYISTDEKEILEYLEEIYDDNYKAVMYIEDNNKIIAAAAGDVCDDNNTIEVLGPFVDLDHNNRNQSAENIIEELNKLSPNYTLQFFLDKENTFLSEIILKNKGRKTKNHYNMVLKLSDQCSYDDKKYIKYSNSRYEIKNIKHQIEKLHNDLFKTSYYNGETILNMLDKKHFISYYMEGENVVCYAFYNSEDDGYLEFVGTSEGYRNRGYAYGMINHISAILKDKGCKNIKLCVDAENKNAVSLYKKLGFEITEDNQVYIID